ncbi:MAG: hypothetical protein U9N14_01995 [Pseudomonadota bacterium]|nr:hypothetical protein [Pseudomonadota bacterium]
MDMGLMVNERGEACVVYNEAFKQGEPSWAEYDHDSRSLNILFEDGQSIDVGFKVDDQVADYLAKGDKLLLVRMDGTEIVEGFDINLVVRQ